MPDETTQHLNKAQFRQETTKTPNQVVTNASSFGTNSNHFNYTQTTFNNGNNEIVSDNVTKSVYATPKVEYYDQNHIATTKGDSSRYVNGRDEASVASRYRIIGNLDSLTHGYVKAANDAKMKVVAMRSGFNDNRNNARLTAAVQLPELTTKDLEKISTMTAEDYAKLPPPIPEPPGANLLTSIGIMVTNEVTRQLAIYEIMAENTAKKLPQIIENYTKELKESITEQVKEMEEFGKDTEIAKECLLNGDFSGALREIQGNADVPKKSTFDKNSYESAVAEAIKISNENIKNN